MIRKCKWVRKILISTEGALGRPITYDNHPTDRDKAWQRYSCTDPNWRDSPLELSNSPLPLRLSRLHPIYISRGQTRITYISVEEKLKIWTVILVNTRITFIMAREKQ